MISIMEKNKAAESASAYRAKDSLLFCLGIIFIGCLIQVAGKAKGDALVFPSVFEILRAFFRLIRTAHTYTLIFTTIAHLFLALFISTLAGIAIGMVEGLWDPARQFLKPLMIMLRSIPMIVLVVIIMVLARYSRVPYIAATLILLPLISEATCEGCRQIDPELIDVYKINGSFSLRILFTVYIPLMAGYLKQAYINAVGMGMKLVISTEYLVQTRDSLGKAVHTSGYFNEYEDIYAYALIMILLIILVTEVPLWVMRRTQKSAILPL